MEGKGGGKSPGARETAKAQSRSVDTKDILSHQELQDDHRCDDPGSGNLRLHKIDGAQLTLREIRVSEY